MTALNIYSLDDTENQNVIACLPEGKHVIGRGDLLKITDKRVSRKHAVIEVSTDKISLTSVHINPCFFRAATGKTLIVISQNQHSELNNGDQFALLPDSCWFKVKIKREQLANEPINGLDDSAAEINGKRIHDINLEENNLNSDSKRARLSTTFHETSMQNDAATNNITPVFTNNAPNMDSSHSNQENEELDAHVQGRHVEGLDASLNPVETGIIKDENNVNEDTLGVIKEEPKENDVENNPNNAVNTVYNATTPNQEIKKEPLNTSSNEELDYSIQGGIRLRYKDLYKEQLPEVKTEKNDNDNRNKDEASGSGTGAKKNISNEQLPVIKMENNDNDDQNKDEASGSGTGVKKVRRERCWYGDRCFRKNPNHRETFSHPGDEDYDPDPDDDRPDCPYGVNCYRKNIEHRRDYKHIGKPAPKPRPNPPNPPVTQNQPNQKNPRKAATKKPKPQYDIESSQDDYDFDDPFINDVSSDDFQPSDDGIDSDSDWEDSQEVESQERKLMLREAKKFTKKRK